jgi:hypothetical protein
MISFGAHRFSMLLFAGIIVFVGGCWTASAKIDCTPWSCTCQGFANFFGTHAGHGFGCVCSCRLSKYFKRPLVYAFVFVTRNPIAHGCSPRRLHALRFCIPLSRSFCSPGFKIVLYKVPPLRIKIGGEAIAVTHLHRTNPAVVVPHVSCREPAAAAPNFSCGEVPNVGPASALRQHQLRQRRLRPCAQPLYSRATLARLARSRRGRGTPFLCSFTHQSRTRLVRNFTFLALMLR